MMDPELMRIAQEQMNRMSPQDLAKIQQQMFSNPELIKLATESMKDMKAEDLRAAAEQLKHTRAEDMAEIGEKMAKASPEELAAMRAHAEARVSYELNAAQRLKQQGNELHSRGKFHDAAQKYLLAKQNLDGNPLPKYRTLQLQCSLNLMSCYLKTKQLEECVKEGSEVLAYDSGNVKALYRRGQAYKEIGNLEAAIYDLTKAHEASPEDETIAEILRDANTKLSKGGTHRSTLGGVIIEEIMEETHPMTEEAKKSSSVEYSMSSPSEVCDSSSRKSVQSGGPSAGAENMWGLKDDHETIRSFQSFISNANTDSLSALGAGSLPPEMVKTATDAISKMKPDELQKMIEMASSLNGKNFNFTMSTADTSSSGPRMGSQFPEMTPEMVNMVFERISKMSPEELQKMVKVAPSLNLSSSPSLMRASDSTDRSILGSQSLSSPTSIACSGENTSDDMFSNLRAASSSSSQPTSAADLQENMRNSMGDTAMHQMFTTMMKNMSPEMMSNMSEQFGVKLSKEEAAKAQQAMSSLSPDDLDRMMRWVERAQKGVEVAKKTKNWFLGKPGMILAICVLILAFIFHKLAFIGG